MIYGDVFKALNKAKIKYAVAGGVAVILHGYVRFTADLDLIVKLDESNLENFFDVLYKMNYRPKVPVTKQDFINADKRKEWIKQKGMVVFSFFHRKDNLKLIDVFVKEPIKFSEINKKLEIVFLKKLKVPTVGIEHLKRLKKIAGRSKDLIDLINLEEIQRMRNEKRKKD